MPTIKNTFQSRFPPSWLTTMPSWVRAFLLSLSRSRCRQFANLRVDWEANPMRAAVGICLLLFVSTLQAEPHVVGFERFHGDSASAEGGAILFSELGCANCHGGSAVAIPRQGPNLLDLRQRVDREWVADFLRNPESGRKGSTMPSMAHGLSDAEIESVIAFLGTTGKGIKFPNDRHANAERGSALYHEKGCIACHAPTSDFKPPHGTGDGFDSALAISHPDLKAKTSLKALSHFLSNPAKYRVDGRMPHIVLDKQEAIDVASHLLDSQGSDPREIGGVNKWPKTAPELQAKGKSLVQKLNCAACHSIEGVKAAEAQSVTDDGSEHCLSIEPVNGLPHYDLTQRQRESLFRYLESPDQIQDTDGSLTLAAMNCFACHDRNGIGGPTRETNAFFVGDEALADSGRLPPPLTGIGHKLKLNWLAEVLAGNPENRVRPYLKTQMPAYRAHSKTFADWFAKLDKVDDATPLVDRPDELEAGRKLLGIHGGVNCITCHHWGEQKSLGIPALDISSLNERLQPSWFRSYLLNPAGYRPGTLMPPLWPGGQASVKDVLEGDAERQIGAIWNFIKSGAGVPEGFPDRSGGQFELVPQDRPIIQRTFLKKTGTKAILVGFPEGVNLAFDGENGHPSLVWRGKFFDAYATWFTRAAPFGEPLSEKVDEFPAPNSKKRFRGYTLDGSGNPTFILSRGDSEVKESFKVEGGKLIRSIEWSDGAAPEVTHPESVTVEDVSGKNSYTYTYSWK